MTPPINKKESILWTLITHVWLFQSIYWKDLQNLIVLNERKEHIKHYLVSVFRYKDVYEVFPEELDDDMTEKFSQIMFWFNDPSSNTQVIQTTAPIK